MIARIIEATNGPQNWGKFVVARFDEAEFRHVSNVSWRPLLAGIGWHPSHVFVLDLQTCEGAGFSPSIGADPKYDLEKHRVWVCPLFEPFLGWLYKQDLSDLSKLPAIINLPDAEFMMFGHRRSGLEPGGTCRPDVNGDPPVPGAKYTSVKERREAFERGERMSGAIERARVGRPTGRNKKKAQKR